MNNFIGGRHNEVVVGVSVSSAVVLVGSVVVGTTSKSSSESIVSVGLLVVEIVLGSGSKSSSEMLISVFFGATLILSVAAVTCTVPVVGATLILSVAGVWVWWLDVE